MRHSDSVSSLYDPSKHRDACGVGFVATTSGQAQNRVLRRALGGLARQAHRGAVAADTATGDGAGVLTEIPLQLFAPLLPGEKTLTPGDLAVGSLFLPQHAPTAAHYRSVVEQTLQDFGLQAAVWRDVPVAPDTIGERARLTMPAIAQLLVLRPHDVKAGLAFEQLLFAVRRRVEQRCESWRRAQDDDAIRRLYIPSFSSRTLVYKGLFVAQQLERFYRDLKDPAYRTRFAVYHQRYSTNTTPSWERSQPFRLLAHNGEINTLQGNVHWMEAREPDLDAMAGPVPLSELKPIVDSRGSDSAMVDNVLEVLSLFGRDIRHAVTMMIPEAWEGIRDMPAHLRAFYQYHGCLMEPWDGPAAITFANGRWVGTALDRNGLRPARYVITDDGYVIAGSEMGAVRIAPEHVVRAGKLGPGGMIAVNVDDGTIMETRDIKEQLANRRPYQDWVARHLVELEGRGAAPATAPDPPRSAEARTALQVAFGYTYEELVTILEPMVQQAKEPVGSMGDDVPPAILSRRARPVFHYFKQRFAQVTNPPIDHLRERMVFSLRTLIGPRGNILEETPEHARLIALESPLLTEPGLDTLLSRARAMELAPEIMDVTFPVSAGPEGLAQAMDALVHEAAAAVRQGAGVLVLSDRGVSPERAPIPSLLAVGAVHQQLVREGIRLRTTLVADSGEPREIHHFACLIGYGANAIHPWLALETVQQIADEKLNDARLDAAAKDPFADAVVRYLKAVDEGLLKIMSKMGISTLDAYTGAQIFEAMGISEDLVQLAFRGTPSRVDGSDLADFGEDVLLWHHDAYPKRPVAGPARVAGGSNGNAAGAPRLEHPGFYTFRKDGEYHEFNPMMVRQLHKAIRTPEVLDGGFDEGFKQFKIYTKSIYDAPISQPRDLLDFVPDRESIPVDEVEPHKVITSRFSTAAMSLGALSPEAHEMLAQAMNRLGGRSNSGEGGEDPRRYGTDRNSATKQVASGRFGVTTRYLASGDELQIKMAQGSKPGEGGQLPGHKVTSYIAQLRQTVPGVALISPPPHHDIYSIEDLAQLIADLKASNPEAQVSVKLVAETGVGIVAAGVAKGHADSILISGNAGGTGSSPLNSIKNAGLPWELGLAETQQTLVANGLRDQVVLRTDGGLKTGRDIVVAAMLGADEYSFGTSAVVAEGCVMARSCHRNNCPVGIATQRDDLRERYPGKLDQVMAYFIFLAEEVREILASLGYRSLHDVIGRTDLLQQIETGHPRADRLDLRPLLVRTGDRVQGPKDPHSVHRPLPLPSPLRDRLWEAVRQGLEAGETVEVHESIRNTDRTIGSTLSWRLLRHTDGGTLAPDSIRLHFEGEAGQSFGAFCNDGMAMTLEGWANDYVAKGMSGGRIVLKPPAEVPYRAAANHIAGNTVLYGATGGELFAAGRMGERFCVRNSGAVAVVEGAGDHACEYMTGGETLILGSVGHNFGAGMTGGVAYVYDEKKRLAQRYNPELVTISPLTGQDRQRIIALIQQHIHWTGSELAAQLLPGLNKGNAATWAPFRKVQPVSDVAEIEGANEGAKGID